MKRFAQQGFTLIELLTVVLIMSIVMSIVGPMYKGGQKSDLNVLGRKLASELRYARSMAISKGETSAIVFDFAKKNYQLQGKKEQNSLPEEVNAKFTLDLADINSDNGKIYFYPDGSSSGGIIELEKAGRHIKVVASWLSGGISVSR